MSSPRDTSAPQAKLGSPPILSTWIRSRKRKTKEKRWNRRRLPNSLPAREFNPRPRPKPRPPRKKSARRDREAEDGSRTLKKGMNNGRPGTANTGRQVNFGPAHFWPYWSWHLRSGPKGNWRRQWIFVRSGKRGARGRSSGYYGCHYGQRIQVRAGRSPSRRQGSESIQVGSQRKDSTLFLQRLGWMASSDRCE